MTIYYTYTIKKTAENDINKYKKILNNNKIIKNILEYRDENIINRYENIRNREENIINDSLIEKNIRNREENIINRYENIRNRDENILYDPLIAPERRVDIRQYPLRILNKINIPTRGYPDNYQLIGLLSRINDEKILQLFGRPTYPGSNQYEYYVTTETNGFTNKIPIETKGKKEIEDGEYISIPIFDQNKGNFQVKLYNYDTPRYNPIL
jgi:hypothetical protein